MEHSSSTEVIWIKSSWLIELSCALEKWIFFTYKELLRKISYSNTNFLYYIIVAVKGLDWCELHRMHTTSSYVVPQCDTWNQLVHAVVFTFLTPHTRKRWDY